MKSKRTPTIEEVDEKLQEIAYGPAKQPWPRSAKISVWVLGILLFIASAYIVLDATTVKPGPYDDRLPPALEEPKGEDTPIIMPDLDDPMIEYSSTDSH